MKNLLPSSVCLAMAILASACHMHRDPVPAVPAVAAPTPVRDSLVAQGQARFLAYKCHDCHGPRGEGTDDAPDLTGTRLDADAIALFLQKPSAHARSVGMPSIPAGSPDLQPLVAFVLSLKRSHPAQYDKGALVFVCALFRRFALPCSPRYNARMPRSQKSGQMHGTTILCVRRDGKVVMAGDGQVTLGDSIIKQSAKKVRRLFEDKVLAGFAGHTADALSLFSRFEGKLQEYHGNLARAAVELAKDWRTDRMLRHLDALLVVADTKSTFVLSGNGDIIEPDDGICAIGSGGSYALAAARALAAHTKLSAREIAQEAMRISSEICIFTNNNFSIEEL